MTQSLPQVTHEHHERILRHVDQLPSIGDRLLTAPVEELRPIIDETSAFLTGSLLPHVDAAEQTLYPELERMYQNRHSMTPMRREHAEVRRLVAGFARLTEQIDAHPLTTAKRLGLRRITFQLYALLKIHLAEEEAYARIVHHEVSTDAGEVLAAAMEHPFAGPA
jgi:hemerythrin-like domain-containing protein